ncbi:uncharacterized protein T551_02868 [Pneumocystis jirovecii RU7]|uniref:Uncharacterized protein n=1 Tax=Pneumocystis jirovecii (strain RU7) TaxID=1408657 RepID=A0A0W4ZHP6_PNEJ7|nr:uncharacterized protein T551_02868 [Pneumocystis jirovecii RU7]KTW27901.1 hypothetical protein T551_02868 [Pneumocystis jirovecii RU7]
MTGLVNYSDSDDDTITCFEKNARKSLKRKELNGVSGLFSSSISSLTKENIRKLPKINKEYEFDEPEKTGISNSSAEEKHLGFSSLLPAPKNNLKMVRLFKNTETGKSDTKRIYISHSITKDKEDEHKENDVDDFQSKVSFFPLNMEKPDIDEYEQMKSDSSFYVPIFVKKNDYLASKRNSDLYNVKLNEKNLPNVHYNELYRVDEDQDFLEHTYLLDKEEKEVSRKEKDIESMRIYGKRRTEQGPINFLEVNAEEEYNTNEMMKKQGLLVEAPQPIRSIGAGRHQITTLLNSAISQREVFEESFAANKEIKRQSGKKYGF